MFRKTKIDVLTDQELKAKDQEVLESLTDEELIFILEQEDEFKAILASDVLAPVEKKLRSKRKSSLIPTAKNLFKKKALLLGIAKRRSAHVKSSNHKIIETFLDFTNPMSYMFLLIDTTFTLVTSIALLTFTIAAVAFTALLAVVGVVHFGGMYKDLKKADDKADRRYELLALQNECVDVYLKRKRGCDLILIASLPENINSLEIKSNAAYVRVKNDNNNQLFYIDKTTEECTEIKINDFIQTFDEELTPTNAAITLSVEKLRKIKLITGHAHGQQVEQDHQQDENNASADDQTVKPDKKRWQKSKNALGSMVLVTSTLFYSYYAVTLALTIAFAGAAFVSVLTGPIGIGVALGVALIIGIGIGYMKYRQDSRNQIINGKRKELERTFDDKYDEFYELHSKAIPKHSPHQIALNESGNKIPPSYGAAPFGVITESTIMDTPLLSSRSKQHNRFFKEKEIIPSGQSLLSENQVHAPYYPLLERRNSQ